MLPAKRRDVAEWAIRFGFGFDGVTEFQGVPKNDNGGE